MGLGNRSPIHALLSVLAYGGVCLLATTAVAAVDPEAETQNFAKTSERDRYVTLTPEFLARLEEQNLSAPVEDAEIAAAEAPLGADQRNYAANICGHRARECAGDVRIYDWEENGFGSSETVLFGARNGATISGKVWATEAGPAKRPGIVITTGSVQAPETLYWPFAAVLAKRGYVVLTYDVQGQGRSDTFGEAPDDQEGVPSQAGQPFYDGTEDALDFLLSGPDAPYAPRDSCGNANGGVGTSHVAKHRRRVDAGFNAAFNPFWELVDPKRIGIAGHSLGAGAVSYIGQIDDRVDAIVAWDNLRAPSSHPECPSGSAPRPDDPPITKPAIGFSNDYGLVATPHPPGSDEPDPQAENGGFIDYVDAGVDTMQVNRRGGTHYEYSFIPGVTVPALGLATLRGMDMSVWYTVAWFDRYVKCQGDAACAAGADSWLLTDRWRDDEREGQIDPGGDPNLYSFYLRSRYAFRTADGSAVSCDDMRAGCPAMGADGEPPGYTYLGDAFRLDEPTGGGGDDGGAGPGPGKPCGLGQEGTDADDDPNTLPPTDAGDAIRGAGGDDKLRGAAGDDCLSGNPGNDILKGEENEDELSGGADDDRLNGGDGDDRARGARGGDRLKGGSGADEINGNKGSDRGAGGEGDDVVKGGGGGDRLDGQGGGDRVRGAKGGDRAKGGEGSDDVNGGEGRDRVVGGAGRDRLHGGNGDDLLLAADGDRDRVICGRGRRDKVIADRRDRVGRGCDQVRIKDSRGQRAP